MDGAGAGKVVEAQTGQPAAAPDPVGLNGVDHRGYDGGVDTVGYKSGALSHGPGHDGGGCGAEHQVEHKIGPVKTLIGCKDIKARFSHETEQILPQKKAEAQEDKHDSSDTEVHQVFHQDISGIFRPCKAGLHHGKASLHPKYQ